MNNTINNYWKSLEPRERLVLGWGGILVSVILLYAFVWEPWKSALTDRDNVVHQLRLDSVWMKQQTEALKGDSSGARKKQYRGADQSLLSVIQQTAKQIDVNDAIQQMVPNQSNDEVRVVLEGVDFNKWVRWVDNLYKNYGVDITSINAEKDDEKPNVAEIRVTFVRS